MMPGTMMTRSDSSLTGVADRLACESGQIAIFGRPEVGDQLALLFSTGQQPLDIVVAECEAIVRRDVVERQICAGSSDGAGPIYRFIARSAVVPPPRPHLAAIG